MASETERSSDLAFRRMGRDAYLATVDIEVARIRRPTNHVIGPPVGSAVIALTKPRLRQIPSGTWFCFKRPYTLAICSGNSMMEAYALFMVAENAARRDGALPFYMGID